MKRYIIELFRRFGIQIAKFESTDVGRRMKIVEHYNINVLFDVGANTGQYATNMRKAGYAQKIISFEPLKNAFELLKLNAAKDTNWIILNYALGEKDWRGSINIAGNSQSSSILNMLPEHIKSAPESIYLSREEIEIKKFDSIFNSFCSTEDNIMVKIDTQGYEKKVLEGALNFMPFMKILQIEMSLIPLYENELVMIEMIGFLDKKGFQLFSLENGFSDLKTGQLLQVDGIFINKTLL